MFNLNRKTTKRCVASQRRRRRQFECLEPRTMFDGNGLLLANDAYLTLSFAADGTNVANQANALAAKFDAIAPRSVWQDAILQAFQTWAVKTNADIGVVADGGQSFGTPGPTHGDARFGDIRIAAIAMDPLVGGESTPLDRLVGGTWQADVVFNTNFNFQSVSDIYEIALHEAGHVFGLDHSTDPNSPMHGGTIPTATQPTAADITNLQSLYGTRVDDFNEHVSGGPSSNNNSFTNATVLVVDDTPGLIRGSSPVLAYGDITSAGDTDFFRLKVPDTYTGSVTIEVRSAGVSLLAPHVRVYDENHSLVLEYSSISKRGDTFTFNVANASPNDIFFIQVDGASNDAFGLGGYSIRTTFNSVAQADLSVLNGYTDASLRKLSQDEIRKLIVPSNDHFLNEDNHVDDNLTNATVLQNRTDFTEPSRFETIGSISSATDADFYRVRSPDTLPVGGNNLTVTLRTLSSGHLIPKVNAFDRNLNPVPVTVLANGSGELVVQIAGIDSNRNYYLEVAADDASGPFNLGNYQLTASFGDQAANFTTYASGTLSSSATQDVRSLYIAQPQLFHFLLEAGAANVNSPTAVIASIYNEANELVCRLAAKVGETQSQGAVLLAPGTYTLKLASLSLASPVITPISYTLSGLAISDPFVSDPNDQTTHPFQNPNPDLFPGLFMYPGPIFSNDPFLWDDFLTSLPSAPPPDIASQVQLLMGSWWSWYWQQDGTNGPPLAQADSYSVTPNFALNTSPTDGVLANDVEPEGEPMVTVLNSAPRVGTLQFNTDGSFQYTPPANFNGVVSFVYQASDFRQLSAETRVTLAIGVVGDYDHSGTVNGSDYNVWRSTYGTTTQLDADGNGDGVVDTIDYLVWRHNQGHAAAASLATSTAVADASTMVAATGGVLPAPTPVPVATLSSASIPSGDLLPSSVAPTTKLSRIAAASENGRGSVASSTNLLALAAGATRMTTLSTGDSAVALDAALDRFGFATPPPNDPQPLSASIAVDVAFAML